METVLVDRTNTGLRWESEGVSGMSTADAADYAAAAAIAGWRVLVMGDGPGAQRVRDAAAGWGVLGPSAIRAGLACHEVTVRRDGSILGYAMARGPAMAIEVVCDGGAGVDTRDCRARPVALERVGAAWRRWLEVER